VHKETGGEFSHLLKRLRKGALALPLLERAKEKEKKKESKAAAKSGQVS